ncbi:MAG: 3-isopropylmalate dehydrogenase [Sphingomicrobium sp.]
MAKVVILPGDGIGPEVAREAVACLRLISDRQRLGFEFEEQPFGGAAIDATGDPFPATTQAACEASDAILLGAVGGPKWDNAPVRPEAGLLRMRGSLGLFANLRPARTYEGLEGFSPLRADIVRGSDVLVVRELTGGLYFGEKVEGTEQASDLCTYSREEVERIARVAFEAARKRRGKVTSVDKANVLATSRLWRRVVNEVATQYPDVELDHALVDSTAMALITHPTRFDVILTENLFGDILSDELSVIGGSIGLLASASTGASGTAVFEPIHGSAPDIAGQDIANPAGAIASAAMLLRHLGHDAEAKLLENAIEQVIAEGLRTRDLGGTATCSQFGERVRAILSERLSAQLEKVA